MAEDKEKFAPLIAKLVPINELPPVVQNEVVNRCNLLKIRKGGHVFKQGDRDQFSYYLLDGEIELVANNQLHNTITSGTDRARYAMAQLQPRQFAARASKVSVVMQVVRDHLDKLMVVHQKEDSGDDTTNYDLASAEVEVEELHAADDVDWMTKMLQSELFSKMPTANIQSLFALLEPVEFQKGDVVIRQGEPGEHYFIIQEGHCQVLRAPTSGGKEIKLADLGPGDSFGEEALITNTPRNATVAMSTPGILMRLQKEKFIELIQKPTLRGVNFDQAVKLVIEGAQWLDVRFKNEHDQGAIHGSLHIPLNVLRMQADKLSTSKSYVVYCDTGGRSSTGAFLLAERGFKVWFLQGGLVNNPKAADILQAAEPEARMVEPPPPAAAKAQPPAPKPQPAPKPAAPPPKARAPEPPPVPKAPPPAADEDVDADKLDPAIKVSVLETELARTNHQLEHMERQRREIMDQAKKAAQAEVTRRLQGERDKIEAAKRQAEEEAKRIRAEEEEGIRRMKAEAEARLQAEKQKLEEVYSRNVEEMEKLQRLKQEAEEHMRRERERLEKESEQARMQMEEAQKARKQLDAAKKSMEQEAEKRRKEQEEMERQIQLKAREKLQGERRKLAEQFARNNQELEQARQERAAADAARGAAKEEADRIIAEYKAKHDAARADEEKRLQAERERLEAEQRKIRDMLAHSERVRREAEEAKSSAAAEVERLRSRQQDDEVTQGRPARDSLDSDIREAEERLNRARREIADAERERVEAEEARRINEEDLVKRYEIEEETRKALEQDLEQFKEHLHQEEKKFASLSSQMEHMRRIKKRADEARQATEQRTDNLLSDVASQLRKEN
ncbi:MAG: cyclic nucleotide-binding domain-containing protein [Gammaproteobacteria bacterium]|nr:cyclic nucleotide-binding domain-containing protein [Gammaproteobacteria bacterium]